MDARKRISDRGFGQRIGAVRLPVAPRDCCRGKLRRRDNSRARFPWSNGGAIVDRGGARIESPGGHAYVGGRAGRSGSAFDEPQRPALCRVRRHYGIFGRNQSETFRVPNPEAGLWRISVQGMRGSGPINFGVETSASKAAKGRLRAAGVASIFQQIFRQRE